MAPVAKPTIAGSGLGTLTGLARRICAWVFLAAAVGLAVPPRPALGQQTVKQMIDEYQQVQQGFRSANEIAENQSKYSDAEVEKAIQDREIFLRRLQVLENAIKARGRKVPGQEKPRQAKQPGSGQGPDVVGEEKPVTDAELELTDRQKRDIAVEEHQISVTKEKLKKVPPNGELAEIYKKTIKRSEGRIRDIRAAARRKLRVPPGGRIEAKQNGDRVETKAPARRRPWKLGDWPWDFDPPSEFPALKEQYYRLQAELGAMLLMRRKDWTQQQAIDYTGKLSTLCALIIDTEERIAFGLGDWRKFERAIRGHKKEWDQYLEKQKLTDSLEAEKDRIFAELQKLMNESGLTPGTPVPSDDGSAQKLAVLQQKHEQATKRFKEAQKDSERAKMQPGPISRARKQRILDGVALTTRKPPKLVIHRRCLGNEASNVYETFLNKDEFQTFTDQSALRRLAQR